MRLVAAALLLAGCVAQPATVTTTQPTGLLAFTTADLKNAITIAQDAAAQPNPPPQAAMIVTCFTLIGTQLSALQPAAPPAGGVTGLATTFTVADLALANVASAASPTAQAQYATACGPLIIYTQNQGMSLLAQVTALGALLAK